MLSGSAMFQLCDQAVASFEQVWKHTGNASLDVLRLWGNHEVPAQLPSPSFGVAGFQKLTHCLSRGEGGLECDLVVVDEAHVSLAPKFSRVLSLLMGANTRLFGLTATPGRTLHESDETRRLARLYGNNLVGLDFGGVPVITALQRKGVLAVVDRQPLPSNLPVLLTEAEWAAVARGGDFPEDVLKRLALDRTRNLAILEKLRALATDGRQTLVFAASVNQSRILAAMMIALGVEAGHVDANTPREVRRVLINRFRRKEIRFLMNYGILTTGFDAPQVDCVFIARPTTSVVLYSQMIGRGLRGPTVGGTSTCLLVDVIDNFENMPNDIDNVYDYFSSVLERGVVRPPGRVPAVRHPLSVLGRSAGSQRFLFSPFIQARAMRHLFRELIPTPGSSRNPMES